MRCGDCGRSVVDPNDHTRGFTTKCGRTLTRSDPTIADGTDGAEAGVQPTVSFCERVGGLSFAPGTHTLAAGVTKKADVP